MHIARRYTSEGKDPFASFAFVTRTSRIANPDGSVGAIADCDKSIEHNPKLGGTYATRGLALLVQGKDAEAQREFDQCLKLSPHLRPWLEQQVSEAKEKRGRRRAM